MNDEMLFGSSVLKSMYKGPKGEDVQLGEIVRAAFTRSGLTASEWNALDDRDPLLWAIVEEWRLS